MNNVLLTFVLIVSWLISLTCQAGSFTINRVVTFGDSLSDNGNLYEISQFYHSVNPSLEVIPGKPYFEGRFCNGPVWVEYLTGYLGLDTNSKQQFDNYAYGGSWVEPSDVSKQIFPPNLNEQVDAFVKLSEEDTVDMKHTLFTFWHGANDILIMRDDPDQVTTNIINLMRAQIERVAQLGAEHFVVVNMPDLGIIPLNIQIRPGHVDEQTEVSMLYNTKLAKMVNELRKSLNVQIVFLDVFRALRVISETKVYRNKTFKKLHFPCYKGRAGLVHVQDDNLKNNEHASLMERVCRKPEEYVFWDWIHPSTAISELIALDAFDGLKDQGWVAAS